MDHEDKTDEITCAAELSNLDSQVLAGVVEFVFPVGGNVGTGTRNLWVYVGFLIWTLLFGDSEPGGSSSGSYISSSCGSSD